MRKNQYISLLSALILFNSLTEARNDACENMEYSRDPKNSTIFLFQNGLEEWDCASQWMEYWADGRFHAYKVGKENQSCDGAHICTEYDDLEKAISSAVKNTGEVSAIASTHEKIRELERKDRRILEKSNVAFFEKSNRNKKECSPSSRHYKR